MKNKRDYFKKELIIKLIAKDKKDGYFKKLEQQLRDKNK
jgi:hypothetical protein